jgi:hypothetical protein
VIAFFFVKCQDACQYRVPCSHFTQQSGEDLKQFLTSARRGLLSCMGMCMCTTLTFCMHAPLACRTCLSTVTASATAAHLLQALHKNKLRCRCISTRPCSQSETELQALPLQAYYEGELALRRITETILREEASLLSEKVRAGGLRVLAGTSILRTQDLQVSSVRECSGVLQGKAGDRD